MTENKTPELPDTLVTDPDGRSLVMEASKYPNDGSHYIRTDGTNGVFVDPEALLRSLAQHTPHLRIVDAVEDAPEALEVLVDTMRALAVDVRHGWESAAGAMLAALADAGLAVAEVANLPEVKIVRDGGGPATCDVVIGGNHVFSGVDRSALLTREAVGPAGALTEGSVDNSDASVSPAGSGEPTTGWTDAEGKPVYAGRAPGGEPEEDERIGAWEAIADHPFFEGCSDEPGTLLEAMNARLAQYGEVVAKAERRAAEAEAEVREERENANADQLADWEKELLRDAEVQDLRAEAANLRDALEKAEERFDAHVNHWDAEAEAEAALERRTAADADYAAARQALTEGATSQEGE